MKNLFSFVSMCVLVPICVSSCVKSEITTPSINVNDGSSITLPTGGTPQTIYVNANVNWTATTPASWLKLSPNSGNKGSCKLSAIAEPNPNYDARTTTITFNGESVSKIVNVTQKQFDVITTTPNLPIFSIDGNGGEILVSPIQTNVMLTCTPEPGADWIKVKTIQSKGLSSYSLVLTIGINSDNNSRSGYVALQGGDAIIKKIMISQDGKFSTINVTTPGTLSTLIPDSQRLATKYLKITGNLNIADYVFIKTSLTNLLKLDLGDLSDTSLPDKALYPMNSLTGIVLPKQLTEIPSYALAETSIKSINIPESVTKIGDHAFYKCTIVKSDITIPDNVTDIGEYAFYDVARDYPNGRLTFGSKLSNIEEFAFANSGFKEVVMNDNLTEIKRDVFSGSTIGKCAFSKNLKYIGINAFRYSHIDTLILPNNLLTISDYAFEYCSARGNLIIPDSVTSIGNNAFGGCTGLKGILVLGKHCAKLIYSFVDVPISKVYCKNPIPPVVNGAFKYSTYLGVTIGSKAAYASASIWKSFSVIEEVDFNTLKF